ncbi:Molybdopterin oxidoreductase, iron-sulfur binding subunit [hydrothermal vent metagenome]|uniref:Molybdopterin oxidoreductase, iron-sulfur binding subunit n=1 Tax=hydrothermal vent metagenome TaxID=652676 RepID=A0A3B1DXT0_9ZZZZ
MKNNSNKTYWVSPAERDGNISAPEDLNVLNILAPAGISRRQFLEAVGFTISAVAVSGCSRAPEEVALPFPKQPAGMQPGTMRYYASTCANSSAGTGLLIGVRDGRPLKMEGMPTHPLSQGGLSAVDQALPLGLYDSHRLKQPLANGKAAKWKEIDQKILGALSELKKKKGVVRFVTSTITSPTLQATIDTFLSQFDNAKQVTFDIQSCSAILDAHEQTEGVRLLPHYLFDRADVIVSFGADFLGTWISPVEFTAAWSKRRVPTKKSPEMSWHVQLESRMTITGSKADTRYRIRPEEQAVLLSHLTQKIAKHAGKVLTNDNLPSATITEEELSEMAKRLWNARGKSLVVSESQDVTVQRLVNALNHLLGNYGKTIDIEKPSRQKQGNDGDVIQLVDELNSDKVDALFVLNVDLTHSLPNRETLAASVQKVPLSVSFASRENDIASLSKYVCPDHHLLESWGDAEPVSGLVSIVQPALQPLGQTRSLLESLAIWSDNKQSGNKLLGKKPSAYKILQASWKKNIFSRQKKTSDFTSFWEKALHDGFTKVIPPPVKTKPYQAETIKSPKENFNPNELTLVLYTKVSMPDTESAHNPWLQELPDPITKITWDNYVTVSSAMADEMQLKDGDVVLVESKQKNLSLELPVLVQPGQHDNVISIALNYGCKGTERFAKVGPQWIEARTSVGENGLIGSNAALFLKREGTSLNNVHSGVTITKTGRRHNLASTQEYGRIDVPKHIAPKGAERRDIIEETTLGAFEKNPKAGSRELHFPTTPQLWAEDHPKGGHHWGMAIDLNACTGCSACLIACQSENNVPVVGKDEVFRQREMHWIRIDRYYSGTGDDVEVAHQPMMCQHCDNAPCETVCPVLATITGEEGLNEQVYNRCVGTRYCANNCPYKVRRFNWFNYSEEETLENLAYNPDVTVRMRGVMEKCSMCVQRIEQGKIESTQTGQPLQEGAIQTACQQSCPASAIVFGDMNDEKSQIYAAINSPRNYQVLEELNVRPSVSYQRMVRNKEEENGHQEEQKHH